MNVAWNAEHNKMRTMSSALADDIRRAAYLTHASMTKSASHRLVNLIEVIRRLETGAVMVSV